MLYNDKSDLAHFIIRKGKWYRVNCFIFHGNTFPHPGGPHRIMLGTSLFSSNVRKTLSWPRTCSCPK